MNYAFAIRNLGAAMALLFGGMAHAVEQLKYQVEEAVGAVEIRRYGAHQLATVTIDEDFEQAGSTAFRPLFDFIGGANATGEKIAMTAPVLQAEGADGWQVSFVMPEHSEHGALPQPAEARVVMQTVAGDLMAAIRYSGRWTLDSYQRHEGLLKGQLAALGYRICGPSVWARYDPPFMPWFLRRNEVLIPVAKAIRGESGPGDAWQAGVATPC